MVGVSGLIRRDWLVAFPFEAEETMAVIKFCQARGFVLLRL
jgi:hypothetical protein